LIGHMVRLFKLYDTFLLLVAAGRAEVASMFHRFITETGIHLLFLMKKGTADVFDSYRRASLAYDKKLLSKAGRWKGTSRLTNEEFTGLESLTKASFEREGLKLDDVAEQECEWGGAQYKKTSAKATAIGAEYQYETGFRFGSQFVHGTWRELEHCHLLRLPHGYEPNTSYTIPSSEILDIPASFAARMAVEYLVHITNDRKHPLVPRMAEFSEWLVRMGESGEEFRKQTRTSKVH